MNSKTQKNICFRLGVARMLDDQRCINTKIAFGVALVGTDSTPHKFAEKLRTLVSLGGNRIRLLITCKQ